MNVDRIEDEVCKAAMESSQRGMGMALALPAQFIGAMMVCSLSRVIYKVLSCDVTFCRTGTERNQCSNYGLHCRQALYREP
jgi:hypothetical protein